MEVKQPSILFREEGDGVIQRSNSTIDMSHDLQADDCSHSKNRGDPICMFNSELGQVKLVRLALVSFFF